MKKERYCPRCNQTSYDHQRVCPRDGALLSLRDAYRLVGGTLDGKYRIDALIGLGGVGAVYSAHQLGLDRRVAFKILQPNLATETPEFVSDFETEAKLAARLTHENIVTIYDYGRTADGISYLAMEWLDGRTLDEALAARGRCDFEYTAGILRQIAAALAVAHAKRIVHRDLKPGNLMLINRPDGGEQVKTLDFGIAKALSSAAASMVSRPIGTSQYASPEQLKLDEEIDERADIYSLGVLLYLMLTGELPIKARTLDQYIAQLMTAKPAPLRHLRPEAPAEIEQLVMGMLAKDPRQRPKSVIEVSRSFEAALRPVSPPAAKSGGLGDIPRRLYETFAGSSQTQSQSKIVVDLKPHPSAPEFEFTTVTVNESGKVIERRKGRARYFVEDLGGGVRLEMVEIPGGEFWMGSSEAEAQSAFADAKRYREDAQLEWFKNETPGHRVVVSPFFIGKYPVTQAQWRAVMGSLPKIGGDFRGDAHPVVNVSWEETVEFCARLSRKTGKTYRLPSEAEWEYAARAGTTTPFAFGPTITPQIVNYAGGYPYGSAPEGEYRGKTVPVGSLGVANAFGLFDMHGNVWEWCQDYWHDSYNGAPTDGSAWLSGGDSTLRVLRGGSWGSNGWGCRAALRVRNGVGARDVNYGFRVGVAART